MPSSAPFCHDCPDHEACSQGAPCEHVKRVDAIWRADRLRLEHAGAYDPIKVEPPKRTWWQRFWSVVV